MTDRSCRKAVLHMIREPCREQPSSRRSSASVCVLGACWGGRRTVGAPPGMRDTQCSSIMSPTWGNVRTGSVDVSDEYGAWRFTPGFCLFSFIPHCLLAVFVSTICCNVCCCMKGRQPLPRTATTQESSMAIPLKPAQALDVSKAAHD